MRDRLKFGRISTPRAKDFRGRNSRLRVQQPVAYRLGLICVSIRGAPGKRASRKIDSIMKMPQKPKKIPSNEYRFEDLERDLLQLDEFLRDSNIQLNDRLALLKPLTSKRPPANYRSSGIILVIILLLTITVLVKNWEYFCWHVSALARIALIRMLPYFDWRYLKNEVCLIPSLTVLAPAKATEAFDCDLCESLSDFHYFPRSTEFIEKLLEVDKPLIISGDIDHWIKDTPSDFIEQMLDQEDFSRSIPCNLYTNVHNSRRGEVDLLTIFQKKQFFDSFFIHFQNCDPKAMKVFRNYTYRPSSLPDEISPVNYNWLLWNKNFNAMRYKKIHLIEKYTAIGQIFGSSRLRLVPRKNCQDLCSVLEGVLSAGQLLVLTSLWDVEYLPEGVDDNMAAILEIKG